MHISASAPCYCFTIAGFIIPERGAFCLTETLKSSREFRCMSLRTPRLSLHGSYVCVSFHFAVVLCECSRAALQFEPLGGSDHRPSCAQRGDESRPRTELYPLQPVR